MAQSAGVSPLSFSPAGQALLGSVGSAALPGETEEQRRKRLAGLQASQKNIASALGIGGLSPVAANLFNF